MARKNNFQNVRIDHEFMILNSIIGSDVSDLILSLITRSMMDSVYLKFNSNWSELFADSFSHSIEVVELFNRHICKNRANKHMGIPFGWIGNYFATTHF